MAQSSLAGAAPLTRGETRDTAYRVSFLGCLLFPNMSASPAIPSHRVVPLHASVPCLPSSCYSFYLMCDPLPYTFFLFVSSRLSLTTEMQRRWW